MGRTIQTLALALSLVGAPAAWAQATPSAGEQMAATVIRQWPAGVISTLKAPGSWGYEDGVLLDGIFAQWKHSGNPAELAYVKASIDRYVTADGTIKMNAEGKPYPLDTHTLDDVELGRAILAVYAQTRDECYAKAAKFLYAQLAVQPRTASGAYWHKQIYPNQIWLDGAYMAEPFRAAYAVAFHQPADFDDIAKQLLLMDEHMRDPRTGLMFHGWDESKAMPWADRRTGLSPSIWARALGWYAVALVDTLEFFPQNHPQRAQLLAVLNRTLSAIVAVQDKSGLWWQVMDRPSDMNNFLEASSSCMFVYALEKSVRLGYIPGRFQANAERGWQGIQKQFVTSTPDGGVNLSGTVKVGGLGGTPYRSGTPSYYYGEKTGDQDAKGVGAYLLAASEMTKR